MEKYFRNVVIRLQNIKIYKSPRMHFCASSNRFRDINISIFDLRKGGQGYGVQFS